MCTLAKATHHIQLLVFCSPPKQSRPVLCHIVPQNLPNSTPCTITIGCLVSKYALQYRVPIGACSCQWCVCVCVCVCVLCVCACACVCVPCVLCVCAVCVCVCAVCVCVCMCAVCAVCVCCVCAHARMCV